MNLLQRVLSVIESPAPRQHMVAIASIFRTVAGKQDSTAKWSFVGGRLRRLPPELQHLVVELLEKADYEAAVQPASGDEGPEDEGPGDEG